MNVDWWDKLKPLRINTKGKNVPQYLKPIPELIDKFGVPFPTAQRAADGWVKSFAAIEGGEITTASQIVDIVLREAATLCQPLRRPSNGHNFSEAGRRSTKENQVGLSARTGWNNG